MAYEKDYRADYKPDFRAPETAQNIIIENRRRAAISGVKDVESFDESEVIMATASGTLFLRGNNLRVGKLSIETGDVTVDGEITAVEYDENEKPQGKLFGRLFK